MTRNIEKSRSMILKNDVNDCCFFVFERFFVFESKSKMIESNVTEKKRFVLKTNDFENVKLLELTCNNLKLKNKTFRNVVKFLSNRRKI